MYQDRVKPKPSKRPKENTKSGKKRRKLKTQMETKGWQTNAASKKIIPNIKRKKIRVWSILAMIRSRICELNWMGMQESNISMKVKLMLQCNMLTNQVLKFTTKGQVRNKWCEDSKLKNTNWDHNAFL